jgi:uncharacterized protein with HEPN domain
MRDDEERLRDMLEAIEQIDRYASQGRDAFEREELIQVWMIHYLQRIGEAARGVSTDLKEQYSDFPWSEAIGLRNVLVHQYWRIELGTIWSIVETIVPDLKVRTTAILQGLLE